MLGFLSSYGKVGGIIKVFTSIHQKIGGHHQPNVTLQVKFFFQGFTLVVNNQLIFCLKSEASNVVH